jgi:hypothetical protein
MAPRPVSTLPAAVRWLPLAALAAHLLLRAALPAPAIERGTVPAAPPAALLRAASLGEPEAAAGLLMLHVQSFDNQRGLSWRALDYPTLAAWLDRALELDPRSQAPLLAASDVYSAVADPGRVRIMLDFVARHYADDPARRWPWMAHAALLARHRLHDAALAQQYGQALQRHLGAADAPPWVREINLALNDTLNNAQSGPSELQAARLLAGGLLASGQVRDAAQLQWLERRLARAAGHHTDHIDPRHQQEQQP